MPSSPTGQRHLERRGTVFVWRRRWPQPPRTAVAAGLDPIDDSSLVLSLRTDVPRDAKMLARRLSRMSDQVFAALAETVMGLSTEEARRMLMTLARFEIEAFERTRALAPTRSPEAAACDLARETATQETLRRALLLRDREVARAPLRHVARLLGVALDEEAEDWRALAVEATRVLLDVSAERARRDQGHYAEPSPAFRAAMAGLEETEADRVPATRGMAPVAPVAAPVEPLPFASAQPSAAIVPGAVAAGPGVAAAPPPAMAGVGAVPAAPVLVAGPRFPGSTDLSPVGAGSDDVGRPATPPVARPGRTPGQDEVFRFYLKHLSPETQAAALRAEGPSVREGFRIYHELKAKGFADDLFHVKQKIVPTTGPKWVRSSGNKVEVGVRIWTRRSRTAWTCSGASRATMAGVRSGRRRTAIGS
ncbi:DUF6538 domain-containing protein [Rubellimicrobium aerolatum]|uniref:DUF6538 domain-containing protein n=1 Tax=Rubellimicrobium aerolatum TaxID=490979 RepID=A0ABW0S8G1_9RHOB|nr:hypothetical protein [Rubellimicrobium aerolatum]